MGSARALAEKSIQRGDTIINLDYLFSGEPGDGIFPADSLPSELLQHSSTG